VTALEIEGPAAAWVKLVGGPCDGHQLVLLDLVLAVVVTRDHPTHKWMVHEYFTGDRPELVANEVAYYRRGAEGPFVHVPDVLALKVIEGQPHWSLAAPTGGLVPVEATAV
jgi:hypothetical protein